MALFDKFKKSTEDAKNKIDKAKAQITQTRDNIINKAGSTVLGNEDTRPYAPQEVLTHEQHECIRVRGERYYQEKLTALPGNFVELDIGKRMVEDREYYHVSTSNGEIVGDIYPDQLEKAGLKIGDVITAIDGTDVKTMDELNEIKNKHKIGDTVTLKVYSEGKTKEIKLTLGESN